jgi:hypothetical protein
MLWIGLGGKALRVASPVGNSVWGEISVYPQGCTPRRRHWTVVGQGPGGQSRGCRVWVVWLGIVESQRCPGPARSKPRILEVGGLTYGRCGWGGGWGDPERGQCGEAKPWEVSVWWSYEEHAFWAKAQRKTSLRAKGLGKRAPLAQTLRR